MSKTFLIILIIIAMTGGVIGYYSKNSVAPISKQLDLKSGSTHIDWVVGTSSYCDGICKNYSSSSSSSSWLGSSWGWGK